ncbi:MAG: hypothetical protein A2X97_05900 [Bdellovibrionales bacterium GWA1_52_35]|nr:MAG: hypothetical protein A2X97_05900 [Bdellovibrionales bacterium GWA1_52_35]HCM41062.1 LysR family transcriptional regulator [Bdellovibrionales bacterium]
MEKLLSERAWELSVLSRAIVFPNLSAAANHVGLSQPQLSRIVARLEGEIGVTLLDRTVRRKSGWTPIAARLAETFLKSARNLESEVQMLVGNAQPRALSIGTLEGLTSIAITFAEQIFKAGGIKLLDLNVYDLNQLEEFFLKGDLNLIFTVREPGRRKFRHIRHLGQQVVEAQQNPSGNYSIMSTFESSSGLQKAVEGTPVLVSNSLAVRRTWLAEYGGTGLLPGEVKRTRKPPASDTGEDRGVFLIGDDLFSEILWKKILGFSY